MNDGTSKTSTTLIRRARANDGNAWKRLVDLYSRRVYRWCRQAGLQPADASNAVQEVLRSVARKLKDFQHDQPQDTFRGWLHRITKNKINDHFRSEGRLVARPRGGSDAHRIMLDVAAAADTDDSEPTWATHAESAESALDDVRLQEVKNEFSDRDWRMFWRVVVDGQSAVEVGKEFAVTANTVRIVKMRLLRRLRSKLKANLNPTHET